MIVRTMVEPPFDAVGSGVGQLGERPKPYNLNSRIPQVRGTLLQVGGQSGEAGEPAAATVGRGSGACRRSGYRG